MSTQSAQIIHHDSQSAHTSIKGNLKKCQSVMNSSSCEASLSGTTPVTEVSIITTPPLLQVEPGPLEVNPCAWEPTTRTAGAASSSTTCTSALNPACLPGVPLSSPPSEASRLRPLQSRVGADALLRNPPKHHVVKLPKSDVAALAQVLRDFYKDTLQACSIRKPMRYSNGTIISCNKRCLLQLV